MRDAPPRERGPPVYRFVGSPRRGGDRGERYHPGPREERRSVVRAVDSSTRWRSDDVDDPEEEDEEQEVESGNGLTE